MEYILLVLIAILIVLVVVLLAKVNNISSSTAPSDIDMVQLEQTLRRNLESTEKMCIYAINTNAEGTRNELKTSLTTQVEQLRLFSEELNKVTKTNNERFDAITRTLERSINRLSEENEKKLEQMRLTVDEKLNSTLETRLNQSFSLISKNLDAVQVGLGEMRALAQGVGDIKKVLSNVKLRGIMAEVQLERLLEQMLAPNQFASQVTIRPGRVNDNKVDFVIYLPGKNDDTVLLPIDAKFPIEAYQHLIDATENGNVADITRFNKELEEAVKKEAASISTKYICPPKTTDFAIMYLPLEGLYAEVVRRSGFVEMLQEKYHIMVCGPTTLCGLLNSLQLGFKTVAIEKRTSEIWQLLSLFKKEFSGFIDLLAKTQKQLNTVGNTIEQATKKSQIIAKKLNKVTLDESDVTITIEDPDETLNLITSSDEDDQ